MKSTRNRIGTRLSPIGLALLLSCLPTRALALDTAEAFELGPSNVEAYWGLGGIGSSHTTADTSYVLGAGLTRRLSIGYELGLSAPGSLRDWTPTHGLMVFTTLVDSDRLSLDAWSTAILEKDAPMVLAPMLEISVGSRPDTDGPGAYAVLGAELSGEQIVLPLTMGGYYTFGSVHQLLLQLDGSYTSTAALDSVGLGYNVVVHEKAEMITELGTQLPSRQMDPALSAFLGVVLTLP